MSEERASVYLDVAADALLDVRRELDDSGEFAREVRDLLLRVSARLEEHLGR